MKICNAASPAYTVTSAVPMAAITTAARWSELRFVEVVILQLSYPSAASRGCDRRGLARPRGAMSRMRRRHERPRRYGVARHPASRTGTDSNTQDLATKQSSTPASSPDLVAQDIADRHESFARRSLLLCNSTSIGWTYTWATTCVLSRSRLKTALCFPSYCAERWCPTSRPSVRAGHFAL